MKKQSRVPNHGGSGGARALTTRVILHIDDDVNDTELLQAASRQAAVPFVLCNVHDGEQAIAYLSGSGRYADRQSFPFPVMILLDLKMPRTSGFEVLKWMRTHSRCSEIPVVVLSGSELQDDIQRAYAMGAHLYIVKPLGFQELVRIVQSLHEFSLCRPVRAMPPSSTVRQDSLLQRHEIRGTWNNGLETG